jgi:hypothetical protein
MLQPQIISGGLSSSDNMFNYTLGRETTERPKSAQEVKGKKAPKRKIGAVENKENVAVVKSMQKMPFKYVHKQVINLGEEEEKSTDEDVARRCMKTPETVEIRIGQVYIDLPSEDIGSSHQGSSVAKQSSQRARQIPT